jgi:hypothetical protein
LLNVYNRNYERIGYIESYSYLSWIRRYSTVGEFELKCAPENLPLLSLGNILAKINDKREVLRNKVHDTRNNGGQSGNELGQGI